ncbi:hypothetical protein GUITHDRAFT_138316 [Guillardia theta CCMP2712]|uniref:PDZ domain-containing protein n=1 Tax=Guillardia theta (strain CCMP2712) TaxID=905079 RepID=L1JD00_GUITC|nr:hypothetical protein GUITHDRAFT_138316 [Guillardia theta CCMP2712]EKX46187.1 hypothetical protein GUITHDRAFT_138316 [Guillardia theta CCMP2712]|eukprot:XP_005833167.1 hypothetical protein GUITHDRAFT_138316 [Guillardia theta CCMP2712]
MVVTSVHGTVGGAQRAATSTDLMKMARDELNPSDVILAVDDMPVTGLNINEVVKLIKGDQGTRVRLKVLQDPEAKNLEHGELLRVARKATTFTQEAAPKEEEEEEENSVQQQKETSVSQAQWARQQLGFM